MQNNNLFFIKVFVITSLFFVGVYSYYIHSPP